MTYTNQTQTEEKAAVDLSRIVLPRRANKPAKKCRDCGGAAPSNHNWWCRIDPAGLRQNDTAQAPAL